MKVGFWKNNKFVGEENIFWFLYNKLHFKLVIWILLLYTKIKY